MMGKYTNWIMVEAADGTSRGHGFMRPAQVAELLEVHRSTLDRWVRTERADGRIGSGAVTIEVVHPDREAEGSCRWCGCRETEEYSFS